VNAAGFATDSSINTAGAGADGVIAFVFTPN
jgi:hypothetical protein